MWLIYALLSAITAALVAIFDKIGLQGVDANTANDNCHRFYGSGNYHLPYFFLSRLIIASA